MELFFAPKRGSQHSPTRPVLSGRRRGLKNMARVAEALLVVVLVLPAGTTNVAQRHTELATPSWANDYANQLITSGIMQARVLPVGRPGQQAFRIGRGGGQRSVSASQALTWPRASRPRWCSSSYKNKSLTQGGTYQGVMAHGSDITIHELLQHRSGLRDMAEDPAALGVVVEAPNAHIYHAL